MEDTLRARESESKSGMDAVLILVLMEDTLRDLSNSEKTTPNQGS